MNNNKIPGDLSRENMISSRRDKITIDVVSIYNKSHCCYTLELQKYQSGMVWYFSGVYLINRTLRDQLEIQSFSSRVEKYFTRSLCLLKKCCSLNTRREIDLSALPCKSSTSLSSIYMTVRE